MSRRAVTSAHLVARVRAWFGLRQEELALYLGCSPALVRHLESGRRALSTAVAQALLPLLPHLPAAETLAAEAPAATLPTGTASPDAAARDFRRRQCQQQATCLLAQAEALAGQARVARHWAEALPALLAAAETEAAQAHPDDSAALARAAWRIGWLQRRARPLPPEAATQWHLLQARAAGLLAEAEALAATIPPPG